MIFSAANLTAAGHADALLMKARGSRLKTGADLNGKIIAVTTLGERSARRRGVDG
jgi:hypothetical protein